MKDKLTPERGNILFGTFPRQRRDFDPGIVALLDDQIPVRWDHGRVAPNPGQGGPVLGIKRQCVVADEVLQVGVVVPMRTLAQDHERVHVDVERTCYTKTVAFV